ncbi:MAG: hypothetical protein AB2L14_06635 [Candidatus Xenobiia bacterium LiM19]
MSILGSISNHTSLGHIDSSRKKELEDLGRTLSDIQSFESGTGTDSVSISKSDPLDLPVKLGGSSALGFMTGFAKGKQEEVDELNKVKEKETKNVAKLESELRKLEQKNREIVSPLLKKAMKNVGVLSGAAGLAALGGAFVMISTPLFMPLFLIGLNGMCFTLFHTMTQYS